MEGLLGVGWKLSYQQSKEGASQSAVVQKAERYNKILALFGLDHHETRIASAELLRACKVYVEQHDKLKSLEAG